MISRENPRYWWLVLALISGLMIYLLAPILSPFLFAAILAYICDPLVDKLEARRVPRTLGTSIVLLLVLGLFVMLLVILIPLFYTELTLLYERLPGFLSQLAENVEPWLQRNVAPDIKLDMVGIKELLTKNIHSGSGGMAGKILSSLGIGGLAVAGFLINLLLIPTVFFYLLRDWDILVAKLDEVIPRRWHKRVLTIAREVDTVLAEFLRGQLAVILVMVFFYVIGLWLIGLEFALPIGVISGLLVFVPYIGMVTGLTLATLAGFMQFGASAGLIWVWVVFGIGQILESMVVTPWLVGNRIGLHPVAVIFALLAFGQIFGFVGILLALPASAVLLVGLRHLRHDYLKSRMYQRMKWRRTTRN
ncbi:MAG: AI-2E family transporter [Pseudomonadota bacterium]